ncbi:MULTISPECIES: hypothetical protein [Methanosarcina]|uniref:hypothetical protein n=1 Tax=Methanosarcina TaxID=2207 RepID=UPI00064E6985|nr:MULTISPECIES: hypothetical protein [Methanosarcina]
MLFNIKKVSIKRLDACKESEVDVSKNYEIKINISITLIDYKESLNNEIVFKSNFSMDIINIGHIGASVDTVVETDNKEKLLSEWDSDSSTTKLPANERVILDNAIYFYIMPLFINISEKMQMPIPLSPLKIKT